MKKVKSYDEAMKVLDITLEELESGELTMDLLTAKINEATELVTYCKKQLRATEKEINSALDKLDD